VETIHLQSSICNLSIDFYIGRFGDWFILKVDRLADGVCACFARFVLRRRKSLTVQWLPRATVREPQSRDQTLWKTVDKLDRPISESFGPSLKIVGFAHEYGTVQIRHRR
jgi:hypothetical protein